MLHCAATNRGFIDPFLSSFFLLANKRFSRSYASARNCCGWIAGLGTQRRGCTRNETREFTLANRFGNYSPGYNDVALLCEIYLLGKIKRGSFRKASSRGMYRRCGAAECRDHVCNARYKRDTNEKRRKEEKRIAMHNGVK